jgi:hypothetical protein
VTWMFELYYMPPSDLVREERIARVIARLGGRLVFREAPEHDGSHNVCLTYEFVAMADAEAAATEVQAAGEYVEGPYPYT